MCLEVISPSNQRTCYNLKEAVNGFRESIKQEIIVTVPATIKTRETVARVNNTREKIYSPLVKARVNLASPEEKY